MPTCWYGELCVRCCSGSSGALQEAAELLLEPVQAAAAAAGGGGGGGGGADLVVLIALSCCSSVSELVSLYAVSPLLDVRFALLPASARKREQFKQQCRERYGSMQLLPASRPTCSCSCSFSEAIQPTTTSGNGAVGLGGTFDHLHAGHRLLLSAALLAADQRSCRHLLVGLCAQDMLSCKSHVDWLESYEVRRHALTDFMESITLPPFELEVVPLHDPFGPALRPECHTLVVSEETREGARSVNERRVQLGLEPLHVLVVGTISPLSSRNIQHKLSSSWLRLRDSMRSRWYRLTSRLKLDEELALPYWQRLSSLYSGSGRFYHTLQHIEHMLSLAELHASQLSDPDCVELAIWFHDAVYDPTRTDNEAKSADMARDFLQNIGMCEGRRKDVVGMIEATRLHFPPDSTREKASLDTSFLLDFDLAILGSDDRRYQNYRDAIWHEYSSVVGRAEFVARRLDVLRSFTLRPSLYFTEPMRHRFETSARRNLAAEIELLSREAALSDT